MDTESAKILGKAAIIVTLLLVGYLMEKNEKDGDGFFTAAIIVFIFSL